jgi:hypothetical protein
MSDEQFREVEMLSGEQQDQYLEWLLKGASPVVACRKVGTGAMAAIETAKRDPEFRRKLAVSRQVMSECVMAAVYRAALEGKVSAMRLWLKENPRPAPEKEEDEGSDEEAAEVSSERLCADPENQTTGRLEEGTTLGRSAPHPLPLSPEYRGEGSIEGSPGGGLSKLAASTTGGRPRRLAGVSGQSPRLAPAAALTGQSFAGCPPA